MLSKVIRFLWGDLSADEIKKFTLLSTTFLFIIGSYWLMRLLKDSIFFNVVGIEYQPKAKMLSVVLMVPLVLFYAKLVDMFEKHVLFYIMCSTYFAIFASIAFLLMHPTIGLANTVTSPDRILGWVTYLSVESFGSLVVSLFWSFVASNTDQASAKRGFPLIVFGAQFGSIAGPTLATYSKTLGLPLLVAIGSCAVGMAMVMITLFICMVPKRMVEGAAAAQEAKKPKTGMIEGLRLLITRPYLLGVLGVATLYEVIGTILDYQMKVLARPIYPTPEAYTAFLGQYGQIVNGLALVFALLGTSALVRRFGLAFCLILFPVLVGFVITYVYLYPVFWVVVSGMAIIKGLSYALNNPVKEIMYIPTSKDVKFKAKSWIDTFGSRTAKATGAIVTDSLKGSAVLLMQAGTLISLGVVGFWIFVAAYVGKTFNKLVKENKIIE